MEYLGVILVVILFFLWTFGGSLSGYIWPPDEPEQRRSPPPGPPDPPAQPQPPASPDERQSE
ncbi:MAG: hypothetical protein JJU45_03060 [Acidimicrobiia bacterium]|nr:hypothetical protein [Acidimicrobiia bacterium]